MEGFKVQKHIASDWEHLWWRYEYCRCFRQCEVKECPISRYFSGAAVKRTVMRSKWSATLKNNDNV
jgi:hypothetical protein